MTSHNISHCFQILDLVTRHPGHPDNMKGAANHLDLAVNLKLVALAGG